MRLTDEQIKSWRKYKRSIVQSPTKKLVKESLTELVFIDSSARTCGTPSDFTVKLHHNLRDVKSMTIHSVNLPNPLLPFVNDHNSFEIEIITKDQNVKRYEGKLNPCNHDWESFAYDIQDELNQICDEYQFIVRYSNGKISIMKKTGEWKFRLVPSAFWWSIGYVASSTSVNIDRIVHKVQSSKNVDGGTRMRLDKPHYLIVGDLIRNEKDVARVINVIDSFTIVVDLMCKTKEIWSGHVCVSGCKFDYLKILQTVSNKNDLYTIIFDGKHNLINGQITQFWSICKKTIHVKVNRVLDEYAIVVESFNDLCKTLWLFCNVRPELSFCCGNRVVSGYLRDASEKHMLVHAPGLLTMDVLDDISLEIPAKNWHTCLKFSIPTDWNRVMICSKELSCMTDARGILTNLAAIVDVSDNTVITQPSREHSIISKISISLRQSDGTIISTFGREWSFILSVNT
jgi:hypothetical protein